MCFSVRQTGYLPPKSLRLHTRPDALSASLFFILPRLFYPKKGIHQALHHGPEKAFGNDCKNF